MKDKPPLRVGLAGLGAVGLEVAKRLIAGVPGLTLAAVAVRDVEKALKESKIGITPLVDGKLIRLPIPELSEERRKDLVKSLKQMAEEARVRVRANRRAAMDEAKKMEKAGQATEDQLRDTEAEIQKLTDRFVKSIDDHLERKDAEVMKV